MRRIVICAGLLAATLAAATKTGQQDYRRQYVRQTYGKRALLSVGAHAAFGEAINRPSQWGRGPAGFGKRLLSGVGTHIVKNSIQFAVAAARHEDLTYYRSPDTRFGPRLRHALVSTVVTRKTTTGQKTVAAGHVSGAVGAGLISRLWQPAAFRTVAGGFATAGILLGATAGTNVAREFWPKHKHRTSR